MDEALTRLERAVEECLSGSLFALSSNDVLACLDRVQVLSQRLAAVQLGLVREVDARALAVEDGATSTGSWLRFRWRCSPGAVSRLVKLASTVDSALPQTGAALAAGRVNVEQAQVIGAAVTGLPVEHRTAGEAYLVEQAAVFGPAELGRLGERLLEVVAPMEAEQRALAELTRAEQRAYTDRGLSILDVPGSGQVRLSGWLDREGGAIVRAALDPLCAPRPDGDGGRDVRSPAQRRADALVDVCRLAMSSGQLPDNGGDRPQIVVTVPLDTLREQLAATTLTAVAGQGSPTARTTPTRSTAPSRSAVSSGTQPTEPVAEVAQLDDGGQLSAHTARRLACDAAILPAILDSHGQVLDLGRQRRLFTGPIRRALALRDRGCTFPSCDRPTRWCDAHHIHHWANGGTTTLDNAALLCTHHHRLIHQNQWRVRINPGDGHPEFLPPPHLDPHQHPRRNTYHRRQ